MKQGEIWQIRLDRFTSKIGYEEELITKIQKTIIKIIGAI